jgi:CRP-like cAMP-binding protein
MPQSHARHVARVNKLLAALPAQEGRFLASVLRSERPPQGQVLTSRTEPATEIWFPGTGVIALSVTDDEGRSVQTAVVGPEGCVGLEAVFGWTPGLADSTVQVAGEMSVIQAAHLRSAIESNAVVHAAFTRFLFDLAAQSLQTTACNRLHSLEARCCRWLLMMQDRTGGDDLPLTQESLATMLGSGRPRINGLLAMLELNGLLRRYRGRIRLLSRSGLERRACECYRWLRFTPKILRDGS